MTNIVLIGFMGSGKSTIAQLLATALAIPCVDSDIYIMDKEQCSITDIFTYKGEAYFRHLESLFIESFATKQDYIIATGGGMPIFHDIKKLGKCFYLQSDFDTIAKRIKAEQERTTTNIRPLFQDKEQALKLYNERIHIYKQICDYVVDAAQNTQNIVANILEILHNHKDNV